VLIRLVRIWYSVGSKPRYHCTTHCVLSA
jgi:hypothetical protein